MSCPICNGYPGCPVCAPEYEPEMEICWECYGEGYVEHDNYEGVMILCPTCNGKGEIEKEY